VKPLCRWYDRFFEVWWIECKVTEKNNPHWRQGEIYDFRDGCLYTKRRTIGEFGRVEYSQPFDTSKLPIVERAQQLLF
jgi:hypothetical protein